ncbi:porin family protein [Hymenobacter sp. BT770]|uniref:porin family protein n=1 Tax=Hymenobacter sp. BT770 TaxID=2886942 RepID=UPI001D0FCAE5|nr:porin family protein [Hymenobacter sp. BT770]MCC3154477.1 PorT family protein [Hymenobacter sp. BT770]MDO3416458.1 porin family protein [Hymenobacter sp. BT770]
MKKTLLFLLLAVGSSTAAFAQARPGGSLSSKDYTGGGVTESRNTGFGIKGGYNYNKLRGDDIKGISRDSHSDFHAGVYGQFGFNEFSSVQAELLYSRQGFTANTGASGAQQTFNMDYISLPIMYVGNVTETISFHVGPQVSLLTNLKQGDTPIDISANGFNSLDYGGVAGLEARIGPARLGARYNLSLGKVFEDGPSTTGLIANRFGNAKIYNNLFQVYLGIGFTQ